MQKPTTIICDKTNVVCKNNKTTKLEIYITEDNPIELNFCDCFFLQKSKTDISFNNESIIKKIKIERNDDFINICNRVDITNICNNNTNVYVHKNMICDNQTLNEKLSILDILKLKDIRLEIFKYIGILWQHVLKEALYPDLLKQIHLKYKLIDR